MERRIIDHGSYTATWQRDPEMHCPRCGAQGVWVRVDERDYLAPEDCTACPHCGAQFGYPNLSVFERIRELA